MPGINGATYPFDPTGTLASNKITGEQHIITPVNYKDYSTIIPDLAPFFTTSFQMEFRDTDNNIVPLQEGIDYYFTHWFISATRACSKPIYGSIGLLNRNLSGVLTITYNTLGGDWNIDEALIAQILADRIHNPRITSWDSVSEMPYAFPVVDHPWDLIDMVGMSEVVESLDSIRDALLATSGGNIEQHILNYDNPHNTNKGHVGLANVQNYPIATKAQAEAGSVNTAYMTPLRTKEAIAALATNSGAALQAHIDDKENPHEVTPAKINAYDKQEINALLLGKLSASGTAIDSSRLEGKTLDEIMLDVESSTVENAMALDGKSLAEVISEALEGKAADSDKLDGNTVTELTTLITNSLRNSFAAQERRSETTLTAADSWTPIATCELGPVGSTTFNPNQFQLLVSGGHDNTSDKFASYNLGIAIDATGDITAKRTNLGSTVSNVTLGVTKSVANNSIVAIIWLRSAGTRAAVDSTALTPGVLKLIKEQPTTPTADIVTVEPADIVYAIDEVPSSLYVSRSEFNAFVEQMTNSFEALNN